ncbi:MAG: RNA-binding protein [Nitrospirae bacterium]|nr:RNA-binding protein [Nitrospirota bacterium]
MGTRLYIGNISFKATEEDIRDLFSQAGEVLSSKLITDAATGRLRGFGFVEMGSEEAAQSAITMFNGKQFMDRAIVVNEAKPQEKKERRGGFGRDRDRRPR